VFKKVGFIVFILCRLTVNAQFLDTIKSITHKRPGIDARFETRNSFFENGRAKVTGVRLGLIFQKKLRVGVGYSWLSSDVYEKKSITNYLGNKDTVNNYLKFGYIAFYTDFVFYKTKRWQVSVPLQWGAGLTWFNYNNGAQDVASSKDYLLLYEPGISVQFKIFRWCGLGTDIAYRFTLQNNRELRNKLNSPTYGFKFLIWFDQLYYLGFPKSKLSKKYGPADW
jgi:hypothetical protein